jgi:glutamate-1-semialdehyde 2,1-aminomutase
LPVTFSEGEMPFADDLAVAYSEKTRRSMELYGRLRLVLPGGETRAVTFYPPYPVAIERGEGPVLWDVDGNRYIDVLNNYTSLIHGHSAAAIVEAASAALREGTAHPAPSERQLALAELLVARFPAVDLVRFTNSGSEAASLALRIARWATGRRRFVVFGGAYHGTTAEFADDGPDVVRVPFNNPDGLRKVVDQSIAAVFAEPFLGSGGVIPAADGFLRVAQEVAQAAGALFVLDEVQSLRTSFGGVHGLLGLQPDLVMMGKIIGGGFPVGAVGGRTEVLALTAADRPDGLKHSGTFNGNPVTMAAGLASMRLLDSGTIDTLNARAAALADSIEGSGRSVGIPVTVTRYGSILHVHLSEAAPANAEETRGEPAAGIVALHRSLLVHGVYAAPRGMLNLSTVLTEAHLDQLASVYEIALEDTARVLDLLPPARAAP